MEDQNKCKIRFGETSLKLAINFLLDLCFFSVGNCVFHQVIYIPMASDPAPFIVNLFLYYYENMWLLSTWQNYLVKARKFCHVFRFVDDLSVLCH